jgi:chaperonin GroEL (HSP60 family)
LADLERAVDDGVRPLRRCNDNQLVYGGGAVEMALSVALQQEAEQVPGLEQYALAAFGKTGSCTARTLANAGWNATRVAGLQTAHKTNLANAGGEICAVGVNVERDGMDDDGVAGAVPPIYANSGRRRSFGDKLSATISCASMPPRLF